METLEVVPRHGVDRRAVDDRLGDQPLPEADAPWVRRPSIAKFDNILPNTWHFGLGGEVQVLRSRSPWGVDLALKVDYTRYMHDLGISFKQRALLELGEKLGVSRGVLSGFATVSF